jgi:hypothetical protein
MSLSIYSMVLVDIILSSVTSFYSQITTVTKFGHINTSGKVSLNVVGVTHDRYAAHGRRKFNTQQLDFRSLCFC